jgi:hypothetical protein
MVNLWFTARSPSPVDGGCGSRQSRAPRFFLRRVRVLRTACEEDSAPSIQQLSPRRPGTRDSLFGRYDDSSALVRLFVIHLVIIPPARLRNLPR